MLRFETDANYKNQFDDLIVLDLLTIEQHNSKKLRKKQHNYNAVEDISSINCVVAN